ncbi:TIGR02757 family protein [Sulfuricurvum sp.]|uniref:TIGR02757 family protein n=1 Tax=Sulfuricurvum sp. TaxID=2025608 RepID=UPI00263434B0|nr:TIGR02757 family protein [Sulfuricurvum sp.]MDD2267384.1 TIGR02757 family protein [Sulfuricurvum sp.]MDD2783064.1 TIGR02757 family protein [Sulfuricurvum sp.]
MKAIQDYLDAEVAARNCEDELCFERPDPLLIARRSMDQHHALTCALFAYGSAKAIVAFLSSLEDDLYDTNESDLRHKLKGKYYRFQTTEDIVQWFRTLGALREIGGAEKVFMQGYKETGIIGGVTSLISTLYDLNSYRSTGYQFLIGKPIDTVNKASAMKRWMMYLRWMVRHDALDMGLWKEVKQSDLIMPLDTHTFNVSRRLGLLERKQCDMKAAIELTEMLKRFDPLDPLKYDFALYRIGQEKLL